ncbi:MAG TPA: tetratricopeptide repeat protein, partial [Longimicrobium sp.]|nr:tetratricopeptide repeat protein [Longimicrobium sp.]
RGDPATAAGLTGSIEAIGGFGKTRLALEYLYRFGPRHFKGGLFWINAESDAELQLYDVLQALNPSAPAIEHVRQGSGGVPGALARAIRSRPDDAPTPLFIIDNVPEPEPNQPPKPLNTWCPVLGEIPVLTTSRTRVALGAGGGVIALPIETLAPDAAVDLLTTETPRATLEDADWREIAEWVGHLPLALEVLNRLLRSGEMTARAVLDLSRNRTPSAAIDEAKKSIQHVVPAGALRGITEVFSASYNLLTPEEQCATRLFAWMAPAPVPTFVIDAFGPDVFPDGVRSKLRHRSLVTEVRDGTGAFYGAMHRVLADFIRAQSKEPEEDVETVASRLTELMESAEGGGADGSALVRECGPLASAVFGNWLTGPVTEGNFLVAWEFANQAGITLARWGHPSLAAEVFTSLMFAAERRFGDEHQATLSAMNNLANTRIYRGDYSGARALQERVLDARRRMLKDEHRDTLGVMNNLAIVRHAQGDLGGAQELQEFVLETRRRILGNGHSETLSAMTNLANTRHDRGDLAGAQELREHVLSEMRRVFGDEHPETATAMNNLASTWNARGDHTKAQELRERVLEMRRRDLGDEHPDTISAMNNLAESWHNLGDHARAQELQEQVLKVLRQQMGLEHPKTTLAAWGLLQIYTAKKDGESANHLIHKHLLWLLNRDPSSLTEKQRQIQAKVRQMLTPTQ